MECRLRKLSSVTLMLVLLFTVVLDEVAGRDDNPMDVANHVKSLSRSSSESKEKVISSVKKMVDNESSDEGSLLSSLRKARGNVGFIHAFVASLSVIIVSELGDKTFFIAAIMAMRHSRVTVFAGAIGALGLMTVLSAVLGYATTIIPKYVTHYASSLLFAVFGIKMIKEGYEMSPDEGQHEYDEVQADLKKRDDERLKQSSGVQDIETGIIRTPGRNLCYGLLGTIFLQAFTLTFLAEWGDRSQIATIILGARENVLGVIIGGILGHALCTGLAVLGGRIVAQKISVRTVTLTGGVVFLVFALSAFAVGPY